MRLHSLTVDDFLEDFEVWRAWADQCEFRDETNPADGVVYPGICLAVPGESVQRRLEGIMGASIKVNSLFLRLSTAGLKAPHQAHTDAVMGRYSMMLYLNRPEHCRGGTSLVRHRETGLDSNPVDQAGLDLWKRDMNESQAWEIAQLCEMKTNRAFIFRADLMHRAEPVGGFGSGAADGRLVMTAFFQ